MAGYHETFTFTSGEIATLRADARVRVAAIGADARVDATIPPSAGTQAFTGDTATTGASGTTYTTIIGTVSSGTSKIIEEPLGAGTKIKIITSGSAEVEFVGV